MALDFPSSPSPGQPYTIGGVTWTFDGVKWVAQGTGTGIYLPLTGGTMTGDLILNRDAQVALGAATFEQVNARGPGDNRLINGDMRIDQRNNGASGTAAGYTVDRWRYSAAQTAKGAWQRIALTAPSPPGFPYAWRFLSSSAYASLATDYFQFNQPIEADMVSDFAWGTANAQSVILSFWAYSSLSGTFSGSIVNGTNDRSYPFTYTLVASTWTKITVTIPGDATGTWVVSGSGVGAVLTFDLGNGVNYRGPANAWASANYVGVTGTVSTVGTNGASFYVTGVKLEIGSVATPYPRQSLAKSLADCQRYYQSYGRILVSGYNVAGSQLYNAFWLPVAMRAGYTLVLGTISYTNASGLVVNTSDIQYIELRISVTTTGLGLGSASATLSAEL